MAGQREVRGRRSRHACGMDLFTRIEAEVREHRATGALEADFRRWQEEREPLRRFNDLEELISACREGTSPEATDLALGALAATAREGDRSAGIFLVWLLLPGLLSARSGLRGGDAFPREDIDAELAAGVWEAAAGLDPPQCSVARRLINAARWRTLVAMRRSIEWAERTLELDVELAAYADGRGWRDEPEEVLDVAVRDGALSPEDAELLMATRATIRALSEKLGLSLKGVQTRRFRARQRFRAWMKNSQEPPVNLPPGASREPPARTG
jgi:hypothetical protein